MSREFGTSMPGIFLEAPGFFKLNTWVGRPLFLHFTSVGCLIASLPKHEVETLVRQQGLKKRTPKTITTMSKLLTDLERVKEEGYAHGRGRKQPRSAMPRRSGFRLHRKCPFVPRPGHCFQIQAAE